MKRHHLLIALATASFFIQAGCDESAEARWEAHRRTVMEEGGLPRAGRLAFTTTSLGSPTESALEYRLGEDGSLAGFRIIPVGGPERGLVVWTPGDGWEKTRGGAVRRLCPREHEEAGLTALFLSGAYLGLEPFSGPREEVLLNWGGAELRLTLEPDGLLAGAEAFLDGRIYSAVLGGPDDDAPHLPRTVSITPEGSPAFELARRGFTELSPDEVELSPPEPSGMVYDYSTGRTIPLRLAGGMLLAPVVIGGLELELALDTGAAMAYLRPEAARRLGLDPVGESVVVSLDGSATRHGVAVLDMLKIGPVTLEEQAVVIGEPSFLLALAAPFDGLVGYDLLARLPARLDVESGRLELLPPDKEPEVPPGAVVLPLKLPGRLPQLAGELDGAGGLDFILDTGSPLELFVLPKSASRLMAHSGAPLEEYT
ncbi:MAG TPA: hypothetical protein ENN88_04595, partial [Candidatus Coatesbacteria bacterium]|nr:hypothetical protein [Candidatus Coatesbacteria bacterium]